MAKKKTTVSVNMKGIEGRGTRIKPGEYLGEVEEVTLEKGDKAQYLAWKFTLDDDAGTAYFNTSLAKNSLWNLRGLLEAMGEDVPDDEMDLDLEDLVGKRVGVIIEMEEYKGKPKPKMVDYFPEDDKSDDESKSDKKKKKKAGKDDDAEKVVKSDVEEMDRDDLLKLNEDHDLELDEDDYKDNKKGLKKLLSDVLEKLDEKDLLSDGEEEDKKGKGKKDKKSKKADKLDRAEVEGMDEDELKDLIKEHDLDTDLDDFKTLGKMVKAVIKELDEKDLLED